MKALITLLLLVPISALATEPCCFYFSSSNMLYLFHVNFSGVVEDIAGLKLNGDGTFSVSGIGQSYDSASASDMARLALNDPLYPRMNWPSYNRATGVLFIPAVYIDDRRYDSVSLKLSGNHWSYVSGVDTGTCIHAC